ncbi:hypothetical protein A2U01_0013080, partial [Trifolium medium]|nr:hypothetical protein [Trifolium medium]
RVRWVVLLLWSVTLLRLLLPVVVEEDVILDESVVRLEFCGGVVVEVGLERMVGNKNAMYHATIRKEVKKEHLLII